MFIIVIMYKFVTTEHQAKYDICPIRSMLVKIYFDDALDLVKKYFDNNRSEKYIIDKPECAYLINKKRKSIKVLKRHYVDSELRNTEIDSSICLFLKLASLMGIEVRYEPIILN